MPQTFIAPLRMLMQRAHHGLVWTTWHTIVTSATFTYCFCNSRRQQYQQIAQQPSQKAPLAAGDVAGVIDRIQQDYQQAYFVTGG
jgi:hypothetical protein